MAKETKSLQRIQMIEQEAISFVVGGFRYGNKMRVFARSDDYLLVWIPGNLSYENREWSFQSAVMMLMRRDQHASTGSVVICEKQSLHNDLFAQNGVIINSFFGAGFNETLDIDKTVVIGDQPVAKPRNDVPFGFERATQLKKDKARLLEVLEIEVSYILAA